MQSDLEVVSLMHSPPDNLLFPLRELPEIPRQKRKESASSSLSDWKICGADTETVDGRVWLFSTEFGVWEVDTFADLLMVLYNRKHARKWKQGRGKSRKTSRGMSTREFFFWNLKFDAQAAILRLIDDDSVNLLLEGETATISVALPEPHGEVEIELHYLEGKHLRIKPVDWFIGQYKVGVCYWWDISQFYGKQRLNNAAKENGFGEKLEVCFDGSKLDVTRLNEPEYRERYRADIEEYAVLDAVLAGKLTRLKRDDFVQNRIRFIRPYSLANVAQRNLLDTCEIPTVNEYMEDRTGHLRYALQKALTAYQGGWFETTGCGYIPHASAVDLASAYPYVMYHLPDTTRGYWVRGDSTESFISWLDEREPYTLGFAEAFIVFEEGLDWYPLVKKSGSGTLVAPRIIRGWFTADELAEAKKWPHTQFVIGEWIRYVEDDSTVRPFRPFIDRFYELKMNSPSGSVAYGVAKVMLNSIYGKTIQAVDGKAGKMWNPFYASTVTGATRARLAELIRLNGFSAVSVATDGVAFRTGDLHKIPARPLPACHNLGQWELDGDGPLLIAMSGVYSMELETKVKTVYRGSAALFLRGYCGQGGKGLFGFCADHADQHTVLATFAKPWSAREARVRGNFALMNVFDDRSYAMRAVGDSTKRLWTGDRPQTFRDLSTEWWPSVPHRDLQEAPILCSEL